MSASDNDPRPRWLQPEGEQRTGPLTPDELRLGQEAMQRSIESVWRQMAAPATTKPRRERVWPIVVGAIVLGLVLLTVSFWAHAAGLVWVNIGDNLQRSGPDKFGTICYHLRSTQTLSCVKTSYFVDGAP